MNKLALSAVLLSTALSMSPPAFAMNCEMEMQATEAAIEKVANSSRKSLATQKLLLARERLAQRNEAACMMHVGKRTVRSCFEHTPNN